MRRLIFSLALAHLLVINDTVAQSSSGGFMSNSGKIYVVISVIVVILLILIFYLVHLDRKISRVEKQLQNGHQNKD